MSGTRRTPLGRSSGVQITPKAIELFTESEKARRARKRADCVLTEQATCRATCGACSAWWDAHDKLHTELQRELWQFPCIPYSPYPPGSAAARDWRPDAEPAELWNLLDKARRATTATRHAIPSSQDGDLTDVEPANADQDADERGPALN
jgi:hypothetical protein